MDITQAKGTMDMKITEGEMIQEAKFFWRFHLANPPLPLDPEIAREGAGSELRSPLFHFGTVMPVYLAVAAYLAKEKSLKGKRLVELGSGSGRALAYLKVRFPELEVVGTDYSYACTAYAKRAYGMYGVDFIHTRAQKTKLPAGSFDFVMSSHVIEHVSKSDGPKFIREVSRLLKRGGTAFIGTPERKHSQDLYLSNPTDAKHLRLVPPHEHEYTLKELKALAGRAKVDKLVNPIFYKIFTASLKRFRPGTPLNWLYQYLRDNTPKEVFDLITKIGSTWQLKRLRLTWKEVLFANRIHSESRPGPAENLLLVMTK